MSSLLLSSDTSSEHSVPGLYTHLDEDEAVVGVVLGRGGRCFWKWWVWFGGVAGVVFLEVMGMFMSTSRYPEIVRNA